MTHSVKLDVFEGPLDLLLHLITKERVDVSQVSVSTITEEYLHAVKAMDEIDLEAASSFLVLAATLLELKTIRLLPRRTVEDPELLALLEERDHLIHRLIEYSTFKRVSEEMRRMFESNHGYHSRVAYVPPELIARAPDLLEGVTPQRLADLAVKAMAPRMVPHVDTFYVAPVRVSVREMIDELAEQVRQDRTTSFRELCQQVTARIQRIVRFLALLELYKMQSIDLQQDQPFGEIVVRWRQPFVKETLDE